MDGAMQGSLTYATLDAVQVKDGALGTRSAVEFERTLERNGLSGTQFTYVDAETGRTILFVNKCPATDLSGCKDLVIVEWPEAPVDFLGSFAFSTLPVPEGVITLAPGTPWERQATVTRSPDGVKVEPGPGLDVASPCSVLTNVVTVDPQTGLVLTCAIQGQAETTVFRHVSGRLPVGIGRAQGTFPRVAQPEPLEGVLPRGADFAYPPGFSHAEAFRVAAERSSGLRAFLADHPRAGLADAFFSGGGSSSLLNLDTYTHEKFTLRFFPGEGGRVGYEVVVAREHLGGRPEVPPSYQVVDGPWDVNHSIPSSADLPAAAVPLPAVDFFNNALGGTAIRSVSVGHTNIPGIGARYQYSLSFPWCDAGTCMLPYAMFDALDGRLAYGMLTHEQIRSLVVGDPAA
ncbi:MAG TPA: hypothetical protein VHH36_08980 [Candidatus Thermoplasmatota archaeon]|nr:hypothetical protein [Candidatus Thermoplasmatota archaeon]